MSKRQVCSECDGTGVFTLVRRQAQQRLFREAIDCPGCHGLGYLDQKPHHAGKPLPKPDPVHPLC